MSSRPLIGVTGQQARARDAQMFLGVLDDSEIDIFFADYAQAVIEAGGLAVYVPYGSDLEMMAAQLDGLLISGGDDINPQLYGHNVQPHTQSSDDLRDSHEIALLQAATAQRLPVVGICRGLQLINVDAGGTLNQHCPDHAFIDGLPGAEVHTVNFEAGTLLHQIYGAAREVNSLHHQKVDQLGSGLKASGQTSDGSVEALEHEELPIVGVQWHPEMMSDRSSDPLFSWLVQVASERNI